MIGNTFSRFMYFDTNIISHFVKNEHLWSKLSTFLRDSGLTLGVGAGQVSELSDAKSLLSDLARFLVNVPTGIIKNWNQIVAEEVTAHPCTGSVALLMYPLNAILFKEDGFTDLLRFLNSKELSDARRNQLQHAEKMKEQHRKLKLNFPPLRSGKYDRSQADEFAMAQVFQWLSYDHRQFLLEIQKDISRLNEKAFQSIRLYAYVVFYKYYLGQREPNKLSDFGDLFHLFPIPYCEIAVMERDLANVLNQIKDNQEILEGTEVLDIDFVRRFE